MSSVILNKVIEYLNKCCFYNSLTNNTITPPVRQLFEITSKLYSNKSYLKFIQSVSSCFAIYYYYNLILTNIKLKK